MNTFYCHCHYEIHMEVPVIAGKAIGPIDSNGDTDVYQFHIHSTNTSSMDYITDGMA